MLARKGGAILEAKDALWKLQDIIVKLDGDCLGARGAGIDQLKTGIAEHLCCFCQYRRT